jgi:nicotinate-nucleotide adenylyltransferase
VSSFRLGLFGGTFDPPHLGHLVVAQDAVELLALDRLLFVVAGLPPHKLPETLSPASVRLNMVQVAVEGNSLFEASGVEMNRPGPSYTVDTLRYFRTAYPTADLFFLLGADQLAEFHEWKEPDAIASLATLVAMDREGSSPEPLLPPGPFAGSDVDLLRIRVTRMDLSSTEVRDRVRNGRSVRYLVPQEVERVIKGHRLYRSIS